MTQLCHVPSLALKDMIGSVFTKKGWQASSSPLSSYSQLTENLSSLTPSSHTILHVYKTIGGKNKIYI